MHTLAHTTTVDSVDNNTGKKIRRLIGPDGNFIDIFDKYFSRLVDKYECDETRRRYIPIASRFIDYMFECNVLGVATTNDEIQAAITGFLSLLERGPYSTIPKVREYAKKVGIRKGLSKNAAGASRAALKVLLATCDDTGRRIREQGKALSLPDNFYTDAGQSFLFIERLSSVTDFEKRRFYQNTLFGGVIRNLVGPNFYFRGGVKIEGSRQKPKHKDEDVKDFPLADFDELIKNCNSFRDKTYFLLKGGGGLRGSEVQNMKLSHVDPESQKVWVHDPRRQRAQSEMSPDEVERFKGRNTSKVFMFEPARSMFFENLKLYLMYEYIPNSGHDYLFRVISGKTVGRALKNASDRGLLKIMKKAQKTMVTKNIKDDQEYYYPPHSLRHMYGVYLQNYIPMANGTYGFQDISKVQIFMGHATVEATEKYAGEDSIIQENNVYAADSLIFESNITLADLPRFIAARYTTEAKKILESISWKSEY